MRRRMVQQALVSFLVMVALLATPTLALADSPDAVLPDVPKCSDMPEAQVPGLPVGSACRVPVQPLPGTIPDSLRGVDLYRSGWTTHHTSESDSDLVEDRIGVWAYLWINGTEILIDDGLDLHDYATHAAWTTSGGSGYVVRQNAWHRVWKAGYQDAAFQTQDIWAEV